MAAVDRRSCRRASQKKLQVVVVKCSTTLHFGNVYYVVRTVLRDAFIAINAETRGIHPTGERDTSRSPEFNN